MVMLIEPAGVAVRALDRDLLERGGDPRRLRRVGLLQRSGDEVDEVERIRGRFRRLDHRLPGARADADPLDAVRGLELLLERLERSEEHTSELQSHSDL